MRPKKEIIVHGQATRGKQKGRRDVENLDRQKEGVIKMRKNERKGETKNSQS